MSELPPLPDLRTFIGRETAVIEIIARLRASLEGDSSRITIMRGWPGVGKTTLAIVIAHHPEVVRLFPDGIFWTSLGDNPDIMSEFTIWGYMLDIGGFKTVSDAKDRLSAIFERKRALLIIDDVYEIEHGKLFSALGGPHCATLFTTRFPQVAGASPMLPVTTSIYWSNSPTMTPLSCSASYAGRQSSATLKMPIRL